MNKVLYRVNGCEQGDCPNQYGGPQFPIIDRDKVAHRVPLANASTYHIYISDEITEPYEYVDMIKSINMAGPMDQIAVHLNSGGGDIYTAIQICNALIMSEADCIAYIEGFCASAATMIALACDAWIMNPLSTFMVHAPTLGNWGKFNEVKASSEYTEKWTKKLFETVYEGFLTEDEMNQCMNNNKDYWFGYDEFMERIHRVVDMRNAKAKAIKEAECECGEDCNCKSTTPSKKPARKGKKEKLVEEATPEAVEKLTK